MKCLKFTLLTVLTLGAIFPVNYTRSRDYDSIYIDVSKADRLQNRYIFTVSNWNAGKKGCLYREYQDEFSIRRKIRCLGDRQIPLWDIDFDSRGQVQSFRRYKNRHVIEQISFNADGQLIEKIDDLGGVSYREICDYIPGSGFLRSRLLYRNDLVQKKIYHVYRKGGLYRINEYDGQDRFLGHQLFTGARTTVNLDGKDSGLEIVRHSYYDMNGRPYNIYFDYYVSNRIVLSKSVLDNTREYIVYKKNGKVDSSLVIDASLDLKKEHTAFFYHNRTVSYEDFVLKDDEKDYRIIHSLIYDNEGANTRERVRIYDNHYVLKEDYILYKQDKHVHRIDKSFVQGSDVHYEYIYNKSGNLTEKRVLDKKYELMGTFRYRYDRSRNLIEEAFYTAEGDLGKKVVYYFDSANERDPVEIAKHLNNYGSEGFYFTGRILYDLLYQEASDPNDGILPVKFDENREKLVRKLKSVHDNKMVKILFYNSRNIIDHYIRISVVPDTLSRRIEFRYYDRQIDFVYAKKKGWEHYKDSKFVREGLGSRKNDPTGRYDEFINSAVDGAGENAGIYRESLKEMIYFTVNHDFHIIAAGKKEYNSHSGAMLSSVDILEKNLKSGKEKNSFERTVEAYIDDVASFDINRSEGEKEILYFR